MKKWYVSKNIYAALFAFVAALAQAKYGWVIEPHYELMFFAAVQAILRLVTKEPVTL